MDVNIYVNIGNNWMASEQPALNTRYTSATSPLSTEGLKVTSQIDI